MEPGLARAEASRLRPRVVSALALAPLPLAAIWLGGYWLALLAVTAAAVMAWEWGRLCRGAIARPLAPGAAEVALIVLAVVAVVASAAEAILAALGVALFGAGLVFLIARLRPGGEPGWMALGLLWIALPCISFIWLAHEETGGRAILLWLLAVVWATDIGAYAIGRSVGGPRLAPRWSPRKTWAGLVGGALSAAFAGGITALALEHSAAQLLIMVSAGLAVVAQFGDLAESLAKRRFGVKDTSALIPGHGGLLDRLDGLLAVLPVVALMTLIGGRSVLAWR
jgi:phosphatidate cytidylyltransferase